MSRATPYSKEELQPEFRAYLAWLEELRALSTRRAGIPASKHYRAKGLTLYTRYGTALVQGRACTAICLANIELEERRRGRGFLTHLMDAVKTAAPSLGVQAITVESVLQEKLALWLQRQGLVKYAGWEESHFGNYVLWVSHPGPQ